MACPIPHSLLSAQCASSVTLHTACRPCHTAEVPAHLLPDQSAKSGPSVTHQPDLATCQLWELDISALGASVSPFVKWGSYWLVSDCCEDLKAKSWHTGSVQSWLMVTSVCPEPSVVPGPEWMFRGLLEEGRIRANPGDLIKSHGERREIKRKMHEEFTQ